MHSHSKESTPRSNVDNVTIPSQLLPGGSTRRTVSEERESEFQRRRNKLKYNRMRADTKGEKARHRTAEIQELRKENEERNKHLTRIQESITSMNQELEQQRILILNLRAQNSFLELELIKVSGGGVPGNSPRLKPDHGMAMVSQVDDQSYKQMSLQRLSLEDDRTIERDSGRVTKHYGEKGSVVDNEGIRLALRGRRG